MIRVNIISCAGCEETIAVTTDNGARYDWPPVPYFGGVMYAAKHECSGPKSIPLTEQDGAAAVAAVAEMMRGNR